MIVSIICILAWMAAVTYCFVTREPDPQEIIAQKNCEINYLRDDIVDAELELQALRERVRKAERTADECRRKRAERPKRAKSSPASVRPAWVYRGTLNQVRGALTHG